MFTDKRSLFSWDRVDDKENMDLENSVYESLSLLHHPAFLPYTLKYIEQVR